MGAESVIRRYSLGYVAENLSLESDVIDVIPVEYLTLMDGELTSATVTKKSAGLLEDGNVYTAEVEMGATLKAKWLGETNRYTCPNVRRGEQVWIWRTGKADQYFWTSLGRDDDLRRLETVIYRYSGFPENADEDITYENSYYHEWSSHKKLMTMATSQRNGEFCTYSFQFNGGEGHTTWQDNVGNWIQMDSKKTDITIENAMKAKVNLDGPNISVVAPAGWIQLLATQQILIKSLTRLILKGPTRTIIL